MIRSSRNINNLKYTLENTENIDVSAESIAATNQARPLFVRSIAGISDSVDHKSSRRVSFMLSGIRVYPNPALPASPRTKEADIPKDVTSRSVASTGQKLDKSAKHWVTCSFQNLVEFELQCKQLSVQPNAIRKVSIPSKIVFKRIVTRHLYYESKVQLETDLSMACLFSVTIPDAENSNVVKNFFSAKQEVCCVVGLAQNSEVVGGTDIKTEMWYYLIPRSGNPLSKFVTKMVPGSVQPLTGITDISSHVSSVAPDVIENSDYLLGVLLLPLSSPLSQSNINVHKAPYNNVPGGRSKNHQKSMRNGDMGRVAHSAAPSFKVPAFMREQSKMKGRDEINLLASFSINKKSGPTIPSEDCQPNQQIFASESDSRIPQISDNGSDPHRIRIGTREERAYNDHLRDHSTQLVVIASCDNKFASSANRCSTESFDGFHGYEDTSSFSDSMPASIESNIDNGETRRSADGKRSSLRLDTKKQDHSNRQAPHETNPGNGDDFEFDIEVPMSCSGDFYSGGNWQPTALKTPLSSGSSSKSTNDPVAPTSAHSAEERLDAAVSSSKGPPYQPGSRSLNPTSRSVSSKQDHDALSSSAQAPRLPGNRSGEGDFDFEFGCEVPISTSGGFYSAAGSLAATKGSAKNDNASGATDRSNAPAGSERDPFHSDTGKRKLGGRLMQESQSREDASDHRRVQRRSNFESVGDDFDFGCEVPISTSGGFYTAAAPETLICSGPFSKLTNDPVAPTSAHSAEERLDAAVSSSKGPPFQPGSRSLNPTSRSVSSKQDHDALSSSAQAPRLPGNRSGEGDFDFEFGCEVPISTSGGFYSAGSTRRAENSTKMHPFRKADDVSMAGRSSSAAPESGQNPPSESVGDKECELFGAKCLVTPGFPIRLSNGRGKTRVLPAWMTEKIV
jgi:hypothetical protein